MATAGPSDLSVFFTYICKSLSFKFGMVSKNQNQIITPKKLQDIGSVVTPIHMQALITTRVETMIAATPTDLSVFFTYISDSHPSRF